MRLITLPFPQTPFLGKGALSLRAESLFCWAAALFPVGRDSVASLRRKRSGRPNPSSVFSSGVVLFDGVVRKEQAGLADTLGRPVPSRPLPLSQRCETKWKHVARKSASDGGLACYIGANTPYVARKTAFHAIFCATSSKFVIGSVDFHRILTCFSVRSLIFLDFHRVCPCRQNLRKRLRDDVLTPADSSGIFAENEDNGRYPYATYRQAAIHQDSCWPLPVFPVGRE